MDAYAFFSKVTRRGAKKQLNMVIITPSAWSKLLSSYLVLE